MTRFSERRHAVASVFIFVLLAAFAVFSTLLVLLGARAYAGIVARSEQGSSQRILVNYPLSKVRAGALRGAVSVEEEQGIPMLVLRQQIDDATYETRIYCYEGSLRELFFSPEEDGGFYPEDGQELAAADLFRPTLEGDTLTFEVGARDGQIYRAGCRLRA